MNSSIILPDTACRFMQVFTKAGFQIYVVGGSIRDILLGHKSTNWDFATSAKPDAIQALFPKTVYNNTFGTVLIPQQENGNTMLYEVTPFRKEAEYTDFRHPQEVLWADTVEEDLIRRDFTINAIAYDGHHVIDVTGGIDDLGKKIIRAVGDPDKRFREDALRLMRAVRFSVQLGFTLEKKTYEALSKNAALLSHISWERIRDELLKILSSPAPADGIMILKETKLLDYILPELVACFAVDQVSPERHHIDDVGTHLVKSLAACRNPDPIVRLATLLHDIGKVDTYVRNPDTGLITFFDHEHVGATQVEKIATRLRLSKKDKEKLILLVKNHMFTVTEVQTDKALWRFLKKVGLENLEAIMDLRTADRVGSGAKETSWRTELFKKRLAEVQNIPFAIKDLKISGDDVMELKNLKPGPEVGKILSELFTKVENGEVKNEREALLHEIVQ